MSYPPSLNRLQLLGLFVVLLGPLSCISAQQSARARSGLKDPSPWEVLNGYLSHRFDIVDTPTVLVLCGISPADVAPTDIVKSPRMSGRPLFPRAYADTVLFDSRCEKGQQDYSGGGKKNVLWIDSLRVTADSAWIVARAQPVSKPGREGGQLRERFLWVLGQEYPGTKSIIFFARPVRAVN